MASSGSRSDASSVENSGPRSNDRLEIFAILAIPTAPPLEAWHLAGLGIFGLSASVGLLLAYRALTIGRVSIVAPITSTEGAIAAIIAVALGDPISVEVAVVLAVIAVGIALAAMERSREVDTEAAPDPAPAPGRPRTHDPAMNRRAALLAFAAACAFSVGLVASARIGATVPLPWIVVGSRIVGITVFALPLLLRGGLRLSRPALPLVVTAGILEAGGAVLFVVAAQDGVATAAVLGSQFAAMASVAAFILFGERLTRVQVAGIVIIALGVAVLAVLRA